MEKEQSPNQPCSENHRLESFREWISKAKKNMYMKDTWQNYEVINRVANEKYTMGQIDKLLNN